LPQSSRHPRSRSRRRSSAQKNVSFFRFNILSIPYGLKFVLKFLYEVLSDSSATTQYSALGHLSNALWASFCGLSFLFILSVLFSLFPFRLSQLDWYLRQFATFAEAAPLLIAALSFALASVLSSNTPRASSKRLILLRRIIRPLVIILLVLLPIQLFLGARFANSNLNINRAERARLSDQGDQLKQSINDAGSKQIFQDLLLKRGIGVDNQKLGNFTLNQAKSQAIAVVDQQYKSQILDLKFRSRRRLLTDILDVARLTLSWLVILLTSVVFQKITKAMSLRSPDQWRKRFVSS
jgi:hypothetical protein